MASGDLLGVFFPQDNEAPSTANALFAIKSASGRPLLRFINATGGLTGRRAIFSSAMPNYYAGGGLVVRVFFSASVDTGSVDIGLEFERVVSDTTVANAATWSTQALTTNVGVPVTAGVIKHADLSISDGAQMASIVAGDLFRFRIQRDSDTDTMAGDLEIYAIRINEA